MEKTDNNEREASLQNHVRNLNFYNFKSFYRDFIDLESCSTFKDLRTTNLFRNLLCGFEDLYDRVRDFDPFKSTSPHSERQKQFSII